MLAEVQEENSETETEQSEDRNKTEKRQSVDNQHSVSMDEQKNNDWRGMIDRGEDLPEPRQKILWTGFKKAWREWYRQAVNPDTTPQTRAENMARYEAGRDYMESLGYQVTEFAHTGSITLTKVDSNFYDDTGRELTDQEVQSRSYPNITGWTEIEPAEAA